MIDLDNDGDQDFLLGFLEVCVKDELMGSGILYFQNNGTSEAPDWQPDSTRFSSFLVHDSMFYAPQIIDIDQDGDHDLFIQKRGQYTFYERINTTEDDWQENPTWLSGIENLEHYHAVFADLTRDGLQDIVFGEFEGTLSFYENTGSSNNPAFRLVPQAFEGIDVDTLAAPAFGDLDGDGLLDLVVGNAPA